MDINTFASLFDQYDVVPVWCDLVGDVLSPISAFHAVGGLGDRFLLESVQTDQSWGRYSFVGVGSAATVTRRRGRITLDGAPLNGFPDDAMEPLVRAIGSRLRAPRIADMPPLAGGAVGVLGAGAMAPYPAGFASWSDSFAATDVIMTIPSTIIAFDHFRQTVRVIQNVFTSCHKTADEAFLAAKLALDRVVDALRHRQPLPLVDVPSREHRIDIRSEPDDMTYAGMLDKALAHVRAGHLDQLAVSRRYWVDAEVSPLDVYRMLRVMNPSPYMYLFDLRGVGVIGSSPQSLVALRDGRISTSAIGGSRPRGADPAADARYVAELRSDAKELSEHAQLVAQAKADLAGLARPGSIVVDSQPAVRLFSHVMHLVTTLCGDLADGVSPADVLAASIPAGTVCGSPRDTAQTVGAALETSPRGLYGGAVGYLDFHGNIDTCIGIRTLFVEGDRFWSRAGASVVAASSVASEVRESSMKVKGGFAAVAAALHTHT